MLEQHVITLARDGGGGGGGGADTCPTYQIIYNQIKHDMSAKATKRAV